MVVWMRRPNSCWACSWRPGLRTTNVVAHPDDVDAAAAADGDGMWSMTQSYWDAVLFDDSMAAVAAIDKIGDGVMLRPVTNCATGHGFLRSSVLAWKSGG